MKNDVLPRWTAGTQVRINPLTRGAYQDASLEIVVSRDGLHVSQYCCTESVAYALQIALRALAEEIGNKAVFA